MVHFSQILRLSKSYKMYPKGRRVQLLQGFHRTRETTWVFLHCAPIFKRTATTPIKRQLISGDNSYQFEKATTRIKRQLISIKTHIRKLKSV